jgi:WD40 repeat protein
MKLISLIFFALLICTPPAASAAELRVDLYGDPLPKGAVARLGTVRYRHPGWNKRIAFLPDNETLLIGTRDNYLGSWNARTGKLFHELDLGDDQLQGYCLSADGLTVATLSRQINPETRDVAERLSLWHAISWRELSQLVWKEPLRMQLTEHIAISPDKRLIAGGAVDGSVKIWDVESGEVKFARPLVRGDVQSLVFSPHNDLLIVGGMQETAIWAYLTDKEPQMIRERDMTSRALCLSHDGKRLVLGGDGRPLRFFDVDTAQQTMQLDHKGRVAQGFCFSRDDKRLLVPSSKSPGIEIYDAETGKLIKRLVSQHECAGGVDESPNGRLIAAVGSYAAFEVWDAATGKSLAEKFVGHFESPYEIMFTPDGKHVATGSLDGTIRIWNAATGQQQRMMKHDRWVAALAMSSDGRQLISCGLDDTVRQWDVATGRAIHKLAGHGNTGGNGNTEVAFAPDGKSFFSFGTDMHLRQYDAATGRVLYDFLIDPEGQKGKRAGAGKPEAGDPFAANPADPFAVSRFDQVRFTPDTKQLILGSAMAGRMLVVDVSTGDVLERYKPESPLEDFASSPDGVHFVTVERASIADRTVPRKSVLRLRDRKTKAVVRELNLPGSYGRQIAFSPSGRLIGFPMIERESLSDRRGKRQICIVDAESLTIKSAIPDASNTWTQMAFSPDDTRLATTEPDSTVTVWDLIQLESVAAAP